MAGSISLSMTQQLDEFGDPLAGGLIYFIQAGTVSTPQNAFQDSALTLPWPNPIVLSASGRIPQLFFADGSIKIRLTDVNGVEILVADGILVVGASSGGGGGSPVDATTVLATGDIKYRYGTGVLGGFVRCNGRTIGNATSGATERANADTSALFSYLYGEDVNLAVSGGRGASAAADYAANKTIALPDARGRVPVGPDGMGNSLAGRLGSGAGSFGANGDTLGFAAGAEIHTLTSANQLPAHTHANTLADPGHQHDLTNSRQASLSGGGSPVVSVRLDGGYVPGEVSTVAGKVTGVTINNVSTGASAAFDTMSPSIIVTPYMKL